MFLAVLLANLPLRWWAPFEERYPLHAMAWVSGLLVMLAGIGFGIPGFFAYVQEASDGVNNTIIATQSDLAYIPGWALLSLPLFLLTTPLGLLSLYLTTSGFIRAVAAFLADDVRGDFVLTAMDAGVRRIVRGSNAARREAERRRLEGAEVPDRLVTGGQLGRPEIELAIVTWRSRPDWTKNTYLVAGNGDAYRLGQAFDLQTPAGLRTAYPLTKLRGGEAIRHSIPYELPPIWRGHMHKRMNN